MMAALRRQLGVYTAMAALVPKLFLAYSIWVWMQYVVQTIAIVIFVYFWQAVYAEQQRIAGLDLQQTLNYIILAQLFLPVVHSSQIIFDFGHLLREGQMGVELLRPVDFQLARYVRNLTEALVALVVQLPLALVAWLLFRFQLPGDPLLWAAFMVTLVLGNAVVFCFDWILGCISLYSTETWGLSVLRYSVATFLSGALVPLVMMPDWLRTISEALPFAQALYVPVSLLSGITPLAAMPRIWLTQALYLVGLALLSRLIFRVAVRKVTIQGG